MCYSCVRSFYEEPDEGCPSDCRCRDCREAIRAAKEEHEAGLAADRAIAAYRDAEW